MKNTKYVTNASENSAKTFKLLKSPNGEITFRATSEEFAPTDNRQTSLSEAIGTHTHYLWWLALVMSDV